jgi:hypothetical protein
MLIPTWRRVSQWSTSANDAGWPSQPKLSFSEAAAVAVQRRVLPSRWLVPMPPRQDRERVVVLEEQLACDVEAERARALLVQELPGALDDRAHRRLPVRLLEVAVAPDEWTRQPVRRTVRLPAVQTLRPEAAVVDAVDLPPPDRNDSAPGDADVERAAVRAENARRLHPALRLSFGVLVDANRPVGAGGMRRAGSPRVGNTVDGRQRPAT